MTVLILKLCIKGGGWPIAKEGGTGDNQNRWVGGRLKGLLAETGAGRLELILMRERSFATPRSRTDITTFSKGEKFRITSKLNSKLRI